MQAQECTERSTMEGDPVTTLAIRNACRASELKPETMNSAVHTRNVGSWVQFPPSAARWRWAPEALFVH